MYMYVYMYMYGGVCVYVYIYIYIRMCITMSFFTPNRLTHILIAIYHV